MTKVLFAAAEAVPFIKTGGLADVMGALPQALQQEGVETALILPKYGQINPVYRDKMEKVYEGYLDLAWRHQYFGVEKLVVNGITVYFVDNEWYFKRDGLYGYGDDSERFAFFSKAVLAALPHLDFKPDIIHCNDWHTGILGAFLKESFYHDEFYWGMKVVYTIHNLKYQGIFGKEIVNDILGLPYYCYTNGNIEFGGCVNYMKAGMYYADYITTVSPSYAEEITYPYFGEKLEAYVRSCQGKLVGIINGLDENAYNPATDKFIAAPYTVANVLEQKALNKEKLQEELGLPVNKNIPLIAMVTRLVEDKGLSLVTRIMDEITQENIQFVVVGTGDEAIEEALNNWEARNPNKVSINLLFSEELAHKVYAGADIFVMPSRFEACGLSQLIALKYGTIPVVRETGGLKDTVIPYNKYTGEGNGLGFLNFNAHELLYSIKSALSFYEDLAQWSQIVTNAMNSNYSWDKSAQVYGKIYAQVLGQSTVEMPASPEEVAVVEAEVVKTKKAPAKKSPVKKTAAKKTTPKKTTAKKATAPKQAKPQAKKEK